MTVFDGFASLQHFSWQVRRRQRQSGVALPVSRRRVPEGALCTAGLTPASSTIAAQSRFQKFPQVLRYGHIAIGCAGVCVRGLQLRLKPPSLLAMAPSKVLLQAQLNVNVGFNIRNNAHRLQPTLRRALVKCIGPGRRLHVLHNSIVLRPSRHIAPTGWREIGTLHSPQSSPLCRTRVAIASLRLLGFLSR